MRKAATADLVLTAGLDCLAGLLPLGLARPAIGVIGRQGGQFQLLPGLSHGRGDLVRIDADRAIQGLADDVLFQAEFEVQEMLTGQETHARLFGRGGNLADGKLFQDLDVAGAKLSRVIAVDLETLERQRPGKKSHVDKSLAFKILPCGQNAYYTRFNGMR